MDEAAFVVNEASPPGGALRARCTSEAAARGWRPCFLGYQPGQDNARLVADLESFARGRRERGLVFAVGGDGTVRTCARALVGTGVPLAVVPRGTANLFGRSLGVPSGLVEALRAGFEGEERNVDVAFANGHLFTTMAGIGTDAAVVASTPRLLKEHLGWVGYALAALPHLVHGPVDMVVRLDGREPLTTRAQAVVVGNVGIMPGGFGLFPDAQMDDGLLDVGVLLPKSVLGWALMARSMLAKGQFGDRCFAHYQAARVEVLAAEELPVQADGDSIGPGRSLDLEIGAEKLKVQAPRHDGARGRPGRLGPPR